MKSLGLFCLAWLALTAFASAPAKASEKPQVTLLVSLDPDLYPKGLAGWLHDYKQYPEKIESTFRQAFQKTGFNLQVIQNANRFDLYEALHSSNNVAVFWVSHEAPISWSAKPGIEINPLLVDHDRSDVKSVFREINPNIRWISLVACDSSLVINWLKSQDLKNPIITNPSVQMQGFNKEVDANKALKQAIQLSKPVLLSPSKDQTQCISETGFPIQIQRRLSAQGSTGSVFFPAVTIEQGGEILGALPEANVQPGVVQIQSQQVFLGAPPTNTAFESRDLQLIIQSGFDPGALPASFELGTFTASGAWEQATWRTFSKADGTPFGVTERVLLYSGQAPDSTQMQNYQPYSCNSMTDEFLH